jgi:hypothetical protein
LVLLKTIADGKWGNYKISSLAGNEKLNGGDGKNLLSGGNVSYGFNRKN